MPQHFRMPDLDAQRAAIQKLSFLVGRWTGEAHLLHAPGEYVELVQTEEVQYKLGGLILVIEGLGRTKSEAHTPVAHPFRGEGFSLPVAHPLTDEAFSSGRETSDPVLLQAFGIISYDDQSGTYLLRAFNDGRFLESPVKLLDKGLGMTWGFTLGEIKTNSILRINDRGDWTELAELTIGSNPPKKLLELTVHPQK